MPKRPDERYAWPQVDETGDFVVDLLGGVVRRRPMSGDELLAREREVERMADKGDPAAQTALARRLFTESPSAEKNRRAVRLLKKALKFNLPSAQLLWGLALLRGQGMAADPKEALVWLEKAAFAQDAAAQVTLAQCLEDGVAGESDPAGALYWRRLAAVRKPYPASSASAEMLADAALAAGRTYEGMGQYAEADRWMTIAAKQSHGPAQFALARLHLRRDWPERSAEASRRWMNEAALSGILEAQFRLGVFFWSGAGGRVDIREAVRWLCRAAEGGHAQAVGMLAGFMLTGNALTLDRLRAWALLKIAEKLGDAASGLTAKGLEHALPLRERRQARDRWLTLPVKDALEDIIPRSER